MAYSLQYYDLILAGILASVIAGGAVGYLTAVAITALGAVAIALIGHALFVNGPVDELEDLTDEVDADLLGGTGPAG